MRRKRGGGMVRPRIRDSRSLDLCLALVKPFRVIHQCTVDVSVYGCFSVVDVGNERADLRLLYGDIGSGSHASDDHGVTIPDRVEHLGVFICRVGTHSMKMLRGFRLVNFLSELLVSRFVAPFLLDNFARFDREDKVKWGTTEVLANRTVFVHNDCDIHRRLHFLSGDDP